MIVARAAALNQLRDLMPVNVVGVNLGQRPGDAEPRELRYAPVMDEQVVMTVPSWPVMAGSTIHSF